MSRGLSLEGKQFGLLKVLARAGSKGPRALWYVGCCCGKDLFLTSAQVQKYRSCGCARDRKDPRRSTGVYRAWAAMRGRCKHAPRYVASGIKVCRRWESFDHFYADMAKAYRPGRTLDRIDNRKGYAPGNCRWATPRQQAQNRRGNVLITTPWGKLTLSEAARRSGILVGTLRNRVVKGWRGEQLFGPASLGGDRRSRAAMREQSSRR